MLRLIVIFVLLGLALLVGGVGAIIDGWPYLVLERGFTQVIVGTVAATAGVILLALSWLLVELRRVRASIQALTFLSATTALPGEPRGPFAAGEREPVLPETAPSRPAMAVPVSEPESRLPGLGTVAAGAGLAAAGGALATAFADRGIGTQEPAEPVRGEHAEAARDESGPPEPEPAQADIFDEALIDVAASTGGGEAPAAGAGEAEAAEPATEEPVAPFAEPDGIEPDDIVAAAASDDAQPVGRGDEAIAAPEDGPELAEEAEPVAAPEPPAEPREEPRRSWWPRFGSRAQEPEPERDATVEADDLAALRQRLTLGPQPPATPAESEEAAGEGKRGDFDLRAAEAWMAPPFDRREPSFDEPAAAGDEAESYIEPEIPAAPEPPAEEPDAAGGQAAAEEQGEAPAEPAAEPPRPAASEEGVIGAYQVGDTHFTMYADGSIKARTPDGEYSFASMDELRAYLASEKSKLGA